jgi:hypothetical protein
MSTVRSTDEGHAQLPVWVTLREARFLTGRPDEELLRQVEAGRVDSSRLSGGRRDPGVLFLRTRDLRVVGLLPDEPLDEGALLRDVDPPSRTAPPAARTQPEAPALRFRERLASLPRARSLIVGVVALSLVGAGVLAVARRHPSRSGPDRPLSSTAGPTSLAWGIRVGDATRVAVVALPAAGSAVALAIPGDTQVDLPGTGPISVSAAASSEGLLVASVQATLRRGVYHFLFSDLADLQGLIDRVGGIEVYVDEPFTYARRDYGPGLEHMSGIAAAAFIESAPPEDATGRWESVLSGVLSSHPQPDAWRTQLGTSDDVAVAGQILEEAQDAQVLELPTAVTETGRQPDREAADQLIDARMTGIWRKLTRVSVVNGDGRPGMGAVLNELLAPHGFRVIASQNADSFDVDRTHVVAGTEDLVPAARRALEVLGVGTVYVSGQATGLTDLFIVVGHDFDVLDASAGASAVPPGGFPETSPGQAQAQPTTAS